MSDNAIRVEWVHSLLDMYSSVSDSSDTSEVADSRASSLLSVSLLLESSMSLEWRHANGAAHKPVSRGVWNTVRKCICDMRIRLAGSTVSGQPEPNSPTVERRIRIRRLDAVTSAARFFVHLNRLLLLLRSHVRLGTRLFEYFENTYFFKLFELFWFKYLKYYI